jgi:UDP-2,4-diacetamido-2,4,6-trideoxy-beta-L-altropyranose hydrolase
MKVAVRADAGRWLGLGHVKRCLAVAHALRGTGAHVRFFWRYVDVDVDAMVRGDGFEAVRIGDGSVDDACADAEAFGAAAQALAPEVVLVDHYRAGGEWHRRARALLRAKIAAIDDLADRPLDVDLLIDHNHSDDHGAKYAGRIVDGTPILGGPRYAMLGPAYAVAARHVPRGRVDSVGIFMGGADAANLSTLAWIACRRYAGFDGTIELATTLNNPNLRSLEELARGDGGRTQISLNQPDLAAFFGRHDLHLGAGGGATWERCCLGAPTLAVIVADNQRPVLLPLARLGVLEVLEQKPTPEALGAAALRLITDASRRAALSRASRALVDGLGASRIAKRMVSLCCE